MPVFESAEQYYAIMDEGFKQLAANPQTTADFHKRRMVVSLQTSDPETWLTIDGRTNPVKASFGSKSDRVDLGLKMAGDLLHGILMSEVTVKSSFLSGNVQVTGNVFRAMQLADLFHQVQRVYPQIRRDLGIDA